jgi:hypothetical protein
LESLTPDWHLPAERERSQKQAIPFEAALQAPVAAVVRNRTQQRPRVKDIQFVVVLPNLPPS